MKERFLEHLRCPECSGCFTLRVWEQSSEIEEGILDCGECGRTYPIVNSIPRLLPDALVHQVVRYHRDFFARRRDLMSSFVARARAVPEDRWWSAERRTVISYSYQWRKFNQMFPQWEQVFRDSIKPMTPAFFSGKTGLDAGCGFGRSLRYSASYGAEMIGLDLSEAIEAARETTRGMDDVHLVQGDIFHPPIAAGSLDFVYSIGVLHHLPDPQRGFETLTKLLKPGAPMFIWVYLRNRGRQIAAFTAMRAVSTRLPLRALNVACLALAAVQWTCWLVPFRVLRGIPATRPLADRMPFTLYAQYPFRVLHTDWFDGLSVPLVNYYRADQIRDWYREAGMEGVQIDQDWNGRALGYAAARGAALAAVTADRPSDGPALHT